MEKKILVLLVVAFVACLLIATSLAPFTIVTKVRTPGTGRYTTNKWAQYPLNAYSAVTYSDAFFKYIQSEGMGLILATDSTGLYVNNSGGSNNYTAAIANFDAATYTIFEKLKNNYTIPVEINLNAISEHTEAEWQQHPTTWYEANFGPVIDHIVNKWGNSLVTGWFYETGWPPFATWIWNKTPTFHVTYGMWGQVWDSDWHTSGGHTNADRLALVDSVAIEIFWLNQYNSGVFMAINYIRQNYPNKPLGVDSQAYGGISVNLWGYKYSPTPDPDLTSELQKSRYRSYIGNLKVATGKFDFEICEWWGNTNDPTIALRDAQGAIQFCLDSHWLDNTPTPPYPTPTATPTPAPR
jgi:hypothetical protein